MSALRVSSLVVKFARREERLQERCSGWAAPGWFRLWMIWATKAGDGGLWLAMLVLVLLFGGEERWRALLAACLAMTVGIAVFVILKRLAGRPRPCTRYNHRWSHVAPPDPFSFPSGHTLTAFAVSVTLVGIYPDLWFGLLFCALSIGASRILLGMHYFTDVLAGAFLGVWLGIAALWTVA
jgi:undecaprenyl-diphosphatase